MHEGRATIGGVPVDETKASWLVGQALQIVDWLYPMLPEHMRRAPPSQEHNFEIERMFTAGKQPVAQGEQPPVTEE